MIYETLRSDNLSKVDIENEIRCCAQYVSEIWNVDAQDTIVYFTEVSQMAEEMCHGYYHRDYNPSLAFLERKHVNLGLILSGGNEVLRQEHVDKSPVFNDCYESKFSNLSNLYPWLQDATPKFSKSNNFQGSTFNTCRHVSFGVAVTTDFLEECHSPATELVRSSLAHFTQAHLINTSVDIKCEVDQFLQLADVNENSLSRDFPWLTKIYHADQG